MLRLLEEVKLRCPGKKLPDRYIVFDTETSGVNPYECHILQLGVAFVESRRVVAVLTQALHREGIFIHPEAIKVHGLTAEKLKAEGIPPKEYIPYLVETFKEYRDLGYMFLGHNMMAFDAPLFEREAKSLGCPFQFGENDILDTGMIVKASQLGLCFKDQETLRGFYKRVSEVRAKGVRWALDKYCYPTYGLVKYGVDISKAHDAGTDCQLAHYLLEELRSLASGVVQ